MFCSKFYRELIVTDLKKNAINKNTRKEINDTEYIDDKYLFISIESYFNLALAIDPNV